MRVAAGFANKMASLKFVADTMYSMLLFAQETATRNLSDQRHKMVRLACTVAMVETSRGQVGRRPETDSQESESTEEAHPAEVPGEQSVRVRSERQSEVERGYCRWTPLLLVLRFERVV